LLLSLILLFQIPGQETKKVDFDRQIRPVLEKSCLLCHGAKKPKGGLDLSNGAKALAGGNSGPLLVPHQPDKSLLYRVLTGQEPGMEMPPPSTSPEKAKKLNAEEVALVREWIQSGANWPGATDKVNGTDWWSLRPLAKVQVPVSVPGNPVDAFLLQKLNAKGIGFAPEADKRTLLRRLSVDLTGLVPTSAEMEAFLSDKSPSAYEKQVDRLLGSIHRAERMARFWMDLVHYGDTHGYDKDQPRPNAWPYRDYLIRSFQSDRPLGRFIFEQIAGDVFYPGTRDGIEALGFLSAGPWDLIGHAEVPETKLDGKIARHLDRDDMVGTAINTFMGLTVQCAQCHNHKFDPIRQEDYYRLQAVFAAVDRADKTYHTDPEIGSRLAGLQKQKEQFEKELMALPGGSLTGLESKLRALGQAAPGKPEAFGFHSAIHPTPDHSEWIEIDLGREVDIERLLLWPCHDEFGGIGAGFGFPTAIKATLDGKALTVLDKISFPGFEPLSIPVQGARGRTLRIEIPKLTLRQGDYIAALAEVEALDAKGKNLARGIVPNTSSSIEAAPRWARANLTDGVKYQAPPELRAKMQGILEQIAKEAALPQNRAAEAKRSELSAKIQNIQAAIASLPPASRVFAATVHNGVGAFRGTGPDGGKPRPIYLLQRGSVAKPLTEVTPGAIASLNHVSIDFPVSGNESGRRAALAKWIANGDNPLTWRVFVNRIWRLHMGRGIVETPSDFGRMGMAPSHPELLDWLATWFRDNGQSPRALSRLIVTSRAYKQSSQASPQTLEADPANLLISRHRRHRLDAESYRDSLLLLSGKLRPEPFGPPYKDFVVEKPEHSPHYLYEKSDPADSSTHRRSIYRFVVRSQQHPFLTTLDTADPSLMTERRNETLGPLQALAMWNNPFVLEMSRGLAAKASKAGAKDKKLDVSESIRELFRTVLLREPTNKELEDWSALVRKGGAKSGMENAARVAFNLGEFVFVD